jgi:hypothetical protein
MNLECRIMNLEAKRQAVSAGGSDRKKIKNKKAKIKDVESLRRNFF